jgi:anaerobic dimethyl sulfoxide reductase subunit B (iron-sulfur subunit)
MAQYGFYHNMNECSTCKTCVIACKDINDLEVGFNFRHVDEYEGGTYLNIWAGSLSLACNHCAMPACFAVCPVSAITKDGETGIVAIDKELCIGCQECVTACPYGVPVFFPNQNIVDKCDACAAQVATGEMPACVSACNTRCLDFGELDTLKAKYGSDLVNTIKGLPAPSETEPSLLIKPKEALRV